MYKRALCLIFTFSFLCILLSGCTKAKLDPNDSIAGTTYKATVDGKVSTITVFTGNLIKGTVKCKNFKLPADYLNSIINISFDYSIKDNIITFKTLRVNGMLPITLTASISSDGNTIKYSKYTYKKQ